MFKLLLSVLVLIGSSKACEITTAGSQLVQAAGTDASLVWNIHRPYNYILNSVECYRNKPKVVGQRTTLAKLRPGQTFVKSIQAENEDRIVVTKAGERYVITIKDVRDTDAGVYSCHVACISGKPFYYDKQITLVVQGEHTNPGNKNGTTKGTNNQGGGTQQTLIIVIGVISVLLLVMTTAAIVYCILKKRNKHRDENSERQSLRKDIHHEEQQYADLSDFQQNNYGELDPSKYQHEYEYVDPQIQQNHLYEKPVKVNISNDTYEAIKLETKK